MKNIKTITIKHNDKHKINKNKKNNNNSNVLNNKDKFTSLYHQMKQYLLSTK